MTLGTNKPRQITVAQSIAGRAPRLDTEAAASRLVSERSNEHPTAL